MPFNDVLEQPDPADELDDRHTHHLFKHKNRACIKRH